MQTLYKLASVRFSLNEHVCHAFVGLDLLSELPMTPNWTDVRGWKENKGVKELE